VLGLLMHYPDLPTVTPVLDYADMIKRCVCGTLLCLSYVSVEYCACRPKMDYSTAPYH
jgi:hypothetical protein